MLTLLDVVLWPLLQALVLITCATIGRMSIPELKKRNYDETLSIGSLAGSGTLGLLIPPSIMLIVYGVLAQVSILKGCL